MIINHKLLILISAAFIITSCKQEAGLIDRNLEEEESLISDKEFKETFNVEIASHHTFNMAYMTSLRVYGANEGSDITVYGRYCNRWHKFLLDTGDGEDKEYRFAIPGDLENLTVAVDGMTYATKSNSEIWARGDGGLETEEMRQALPFGWIMAVEVPSTTDYDFNDLVMRFEPVTGGNIKVTALACGINRPVWLHFTDGIKDYIVSPEAYTGYALETEFMDEMTQDIYEFHNWFGDGYNNVISTYTVNTLTGYNGLTGRTVELPASLVGSISIPFISICQLQTVNGIQDCPVPTLGFYITVADYDIKEMDDNKRQARIVASMPDGEKPQLLIFPDVCVDDSPTCFYGWRWPSENSLISNVYPDFLTWLTDPDHNWYKYAPSGWSDSAGITDDRGIQLYYGYYPRNPIK